MKKSTKPAASSKSLRPGASAPHSTRDSFVNMGARLGYGSANQASGGSYQIDYTSHNRWQLEAMYRSSWICGKAVDAIAEDMTKRGIEVTSEVDPGEIDQLMAFWNALRLGDKIADTIKWARLYGGAIAVMLIDGQDLSTPLRIETVNRDQFKGLQVLDRWCVNPSLSNLVTQLGPDLGLPMFYDVINDSMALKAAHIHYSRVIRIEGQDLPYWQRIGEMLWGQSVLERLYDRLLAFDSTTQGAAQLVYKAHLRTYKIEGLRDVIAMGGPGLEGLIKQIEFIRSTQTNEGMTLMDSSDTFEAHSYAFGGLDTVLLQFAQQLSGALNIPLTRLFGQSPSGLSATGENDIRVYYDGINQEQERRLRTGVDKLLRITYQSVFGKVLKTGSDFTFRPLWQLTEIEKGSLAGTVTTAVTAAFTSGMIDQQTAMKELRQSSRLTGVFTNISDAAIAASPDEIGGELGGELDEDEDEPAPKKGVKDAFAEAKIKREGDGKFGEKGGTGAVSVEHKTLARGIQSEVYSHAASAEATLQVVTRNDGYRAVSDVYVPEGDQGKGIGSSMYLKALESGPLLHEKSEGDNLTLAASRTRASLINKGLAESYSDPYGRTLLRRK